MHPSKKFREIKNGDFVGQLSAVLLVSVLRHRKSEMYIKVHYYDANPKVDLLYILSTSVC